MKKKFSICFLALCVLLGTAFADDIDVIDHGLSGVHEDGEELIEGIVQLTKSESWDWVTSWGANPWSSDGQRIVYQRAFDDAPEICVMNADGGNFFQLTDNDRCDSHPSFVAPLNNRIVFQRNVEIMDSSHGEIWIMDDNGNNPVSLTQAHLGQVGDPDECESKPMVSPDGTKVAFRSDYESLWVMDINGANPVKISEELESCSKHFWHPNSLTVIFTAEDYGNAKINGGNQKIYTAPANGSAPPTCLSPGDGDPAVVEMEDLEENWAQFSPDGNTISFHQRFYRLVPMDPAFFGMRVAEKPDDELPMEEEIVTRVLLMDATGGSRRIIAECIETEGDDLKLGIPMEIEYIKATGVMSWSPDSKYLIYRLQTARWDDDFDIKGPGGTRESHFFVADVNTEESVQLTEGYQDSAPYWAPSGNNILFTEYGCDEKPGSDTRDNNQYYNDLLLMKWKSQGGQVGDADLNGDGKVDRKDRRLFGACLGSSSGDPEFNPAADMDGDGEITYADYRLFLEVMRGRRR